MHIEQKSEKQKNYSRYKLNKDIEENVHAQNFWENFIIYMLNSSLTVLAFPIKNFLVYVHITMNKKVLDIVRYRFRCLIISTDSERTHTLCRNAQIFF